MEHKVVTLFIFLAYGFPSPRLWLPRLRREVLRRAKNVASRVFVPRHLLSLSTQASRCSAAGTGVCRAWLHARCRLCFWSALLAWRLCQQRNTRNTRRA